MGDSFSAIRDDQNEHDHYMQKTGLAGDKKYGGIQCYGADADVVAKAAREGLSKRDTIERLISDRHARAAAKEFNEEMDERDKLEQLRSKY